MKCRHTAAKGTAASPSWPRLICLSFITLLALAVRPELQTGDRPWLSLLFRAFDIDPVLHLLLFVSFCFFYRQALMYISKAAWSRKDKLCVTLPAGFFAAAMVFGRSFADTASWNLVFGNSLQFVKSLIIWDGYFILFSIAIAALFTWLSSARLWCKKGSPAPRPGLWGRYLRCWNAHPFLTPFLTMLAVYLPYMILSYPGIMMGDTGNIILQGFGLPEDTSNYLNLIDETVRLNGHHPVVYTMLLHICMVLGNGLFGSYRVGLFLASTFQLVAQFAAMAAVLAQLTRLRLRRELTLGLMAFFTLAPRVQNYAFLLTKDVLTCCVLLLFLLSVFRLLAGEGRDAQNMVCCAAAGLGLCLLRNEGQYVLLAFLAIALFLVPKKRWQLIVPGMAVLLCVLLFFHALMPVLRITPGSKREMLSVPFQQTARYLRDHPEDVSAEERAAIAAVLNYDELAQRYTPTVSDKVKATYREATTGAELGAYFKVWIQMGLRHPGAYLQATMNNYYNYFYPGSKLVILYSYDWSSSHAGLQDLKRLPNQSNGTLDLSHPEGLHELRQGYETLRESLFELPLLSLLKSAATYVWGLILLVFYHIKRRGLPSLALTLPLVLLVGVCLLGPCNGDYFRYLYGVSVALPAVFFLSLYLADHPEKE